MDLSKCWEPRSIKIRKIARMVASKLTRISKQTGVSIRYTLTLADQKMALRRLLADSNKNVDGQFLSPQIVAINTSKATSSLSKIKARLVSQKSQEYFAAHPKNPSKDSGTTLFTKEYS